MMLGAEYQPTCLFCRKRWTADCPIRVWGRTERNAGKFLDVQFNDYCSRYEGGIMPVNTPEQPREPNFPELAATANCADIVIKKVSNGFIIHVGCKTFVTRTWVEAYTGLDLYFKDPSSARTIYCEDEKGA
jgi:hypothetical protein